VVKDMRVDAVIALGLAEHPDLSPPSRMKPPYIPVSPCELGRPFACQDSDL
jgi:hypothetical protein